MVRPIRGDKKSPNKGFYACKRCPGFTYNKGRICKICLGREPLPTVPTNPRTD